MNKLDSFAKKVFCSEKPERLINEKQWDMLRSWLKDLKIKPLKLYDVAIKLKCDWPYSKANEKLEEYLEVDFGCLKSNYGWTQKKVIISSMVYAFCLNVKELQETMAKDIVANFFDGSKDNQPVDMNLYDNRPKPRKIKYKVAKVENSPLAMNKRKKIEIDFNVLLNSETPWNYVDEVMWNGWRAKIISANTPSLRVEDIAKEAGFFAGNDVKSITVKELSEITYDFLHSFSRTMDKRAVFLSVAYLGTGNTVMCKSRVQQKSLEKNVVSPKRKEGPSVETLEEILQEFGI